MSPLHPCVSPCFVPFPITLLSSPYSSWWLLSCPTTHTYTVYENFFMHTWWASMYVCVMFVCRWVCTCVKSSALHITLSQHLSSNPELTGRLDLVSFSHGWNYRGAATPSHYASWHLCGSWESELQPNHLYRSSFTSQARAVCAGPSSQCFFTTGLLSALEVLIFTADH